MVMTYSEDHGPLADKTPCAGSRADLKMCLLESDCCKKSEVLPADGVIIEKHKYGCDHRNRLQIKICVLKKTPKECLHVTDGTVPQECFALRVAFFECKRSALDNRQRFRGRKSY